VFFRRRAKQQAPLEPFTDAAVASVPGAPGNEERAHELVLNIMRAAPDLRFHAARQLGLLQPGEAGSGPDFERALLERARDTGMLAPLEEAIAR
jgi:hypothetical protein